MPKPLQNGLPEAWRNGTPFERMAHVTAQSLADDMKEKAMDDAGVPAWDYVSRSRPCPHAKMWESGPCRECSNG
jgi:hypothetical protein